MLWIRSYLCCDICFFKASAKVEKEVRFEEPASHRILTCSELAEPVAARMSTSKVAFERAEPSSRIERSAPPRAIFARSIMIAIFLFIRISAFVR